MRWSPLILGLSLLGVTAVARADPPREPVESIICRGMSAVGFSYAWGGECWCAAGCAPDFESCDPGSCSGSCPSCSHSGRYGADCSGFVSRAWQVPRAFPVDACDTDRYVASSFTSDHEFWDNVSVSRLRPGDAAASSSHVVLIVGAADGSGYYDVVEARGCSYGIVHRRRSVSSYTGARRINLVDCTCDDGDVETRDCGDCGTQRRTCEEGCSWSAWSECEGPDPTGADADCTVEDALGACAEGVRLCVAGWLTCLPSSATTEVCDGVDNDCDGVVDNGTPETLGEGFPCTNECGPGETQCIDGAVRCVTPGSTWPDGQCEETDGGATDGGSDDGGTPDGGATDGGSNDGGPPDGGDPLDAGGSGLPVSGLRGGCACSSSAEAGAAPFAPVLAFLVVLAWRRRRPVSR